MLNSVYSSLGSDRKKRGASKIHSIPVVVDNTSSRSSDRPEWLKGKSPNTRAVEALKSTLRDHNLHTVCEEAACPNLPECFGMGTATFMIMGDICTRRCSFCDVAHGTPYKLDEDEPANLAKLVAAMQLRYVVVTSVDRDDLDDAGAGHFSACITELRATCPGIKIEILVPDFRNKVELALKVLSETPPDVFNHNIETVSRLYKRVKPGSDYLSSLSLISDFKKMNNSVPTKSGMMLGLGENRAEVETVILDLLEHDCDMITLGQYLPPSKYHAPVHRYVEPDEFEYYKQFALKHGFISVNSGPLVRSSYHAEDQLHAID